MSEKKFRKISHPEQDIFLHLSNFSNEVSQLTDLQTYNLYLFGKNIPGMSLKNFRKISHPEQDISLY